MKLYLRNPVRTHTRWYLLDRCRRSNRIQWSTQSVQHCSSTRSNQARMCSNNCPAVDEQKLQFSACDTSTNTQNNNKSTGAEHATMMRSTSNDQLTPWVGNLIIPRRPADTYVVRAHGGPETGPVRAPDSLRAIDARPTVRTDTSPSVAQVVLANAAVQTRVRPTKFDPPFACGA